MAGARDSALDCTDFSSARLADSDVHVVVGMWCAFVSLTTVGCPLFFWQVGLVAIGYFRVDWVFFLEVALSSRGSFLVALTRETERGYPYLLQTAYHAVHRADWWKHILVQTCNASLV